MMENNINNRWRRVRRNTQISVVLVTIFVVLFVTQYTLYVTHKDDNNINNAIVSVSAMKEKNSEALIHYKDYLATKQYVDLVSGNLSASMSTQDLSQLNNMRVTQPYFYDKLVNSNTTINACFKYKYVVEPKDLQFVVNDEDGSIICRLNKSAITPYNVTRSDVDSILTLDNLHSGRTKDSSNEINNFISNYNVQIVNNILTSGNVKTKTYDKIKANLTKDMTEFGFENISIELIDPVIESSPNSVQIDIVDDKTK